MRRIEQPSFCDPANLTWGVAPGGTIEALVIGDLVRDLSDAERVDQATGKVTFARPPAFDVKMLVARPW